jgi:hypothetical protein
MPGPNNVALTRVSARRVGATIADATLKITDPFEVVIEAEAGATVLGSGTSYKTDIRIRDLWDNNDIAFTAKPVVAGTYEAKPQGNLGAAEWKTADQKIIFDVAAAGLAGRGDHPCQVLAYLQTRLADPDVEFAQSPVFTLIP